MRDYSFNLANIFGDHMVLQRSKPLTIWGECYQAQVIRVLLDGREIASTEAAVGRWMVTLPAMAVRRNLTLQVLGENESYTFQDVAVGEVWVAGGQSNMEFLLDYDAEAEKVIPEADNSDIRFYDCPKIKFEGQEKEDDMSQYGFWRLLDPANAPFYSAVGFYFANQLYIRYQVPIGIVGCNWGGTTAAAWMDADYLRDNELLSVYVDEYEAGLKNLDLDQYFQAEESQRKVMSLPPAKRFMNYIMKRTPRGVRRLFISIPVRRSINKSQQLGPRSENRPGGLFHTMLEKIIPYTARGVIWYQGESDDPKANFYARLFSSLIRCWRERWEEALPFLFVQLAPYEHWLGERAQNFTILREQQEMVSKTVPGTYMASIMDAGSKVDIHPKQKRPVGERLALLARGKIYGEKILCEAPEFADAVVESGTVVIKFKHTGEGLSLRGDHLKSLVLFSDGKKVRRPEISVDRDSLRIRAKGIQTASEIEIHFAFENFAEVNLYNSAGLPAKPFRYKLER